MSDLISRQAVEDLIMETDPWWCEGMTRAILEGAKRLPSIDAVPVVRCKECKHSEHWYRDKRRCFFWHEVGIGVFEDGFCNYGERSEE